MSKKQNETEVVELNPNETEPKEEEPKEPELVRTETTTMPLDEFIEMFTKWRLEQYGQIVVDVASNSERPIFRFNVERVKK